MSKLTIYSASAGSGKTYTLTEAYLKLVIKQPSNYKHVIAVTFTNKATEEMKQRIIEKLSELANNKPCDHLDQLKFHTKFSTLKIRNNAKEVLNSVLHNYSAFGVSTIDSFFQKIIRSFIKELGLKGGFSIELNQSKVLDSTVDQLFNNIGKENRITSWILDYVKTRVESGKSWNIQDNLRVLSKNILNEEFKLIENKGFNNRDIDQLKAFVKQLESYNKTFINDLKQVGLQFSEIIQANHLSIDDFSSKKGGIAGYFLKLATEKDYVPGIKIKQALEDTEKWVSKTHTNRSIILNLVQDQLHPLLQQAFEYINSKEEKYLTNKLILDNIYIFGVYNDLLTELKNYRDEHNILMLSDITDMLNNIIGNNHAPFIYEKVGTHFHHFLIDEFQDTSRLQWSNFKPLIENSLAEGNENLIVGDVKQAIYRWRGGDWKILLKDVEEELGDRLVNKKVLSNNYRSTKSIVDFNNKIFSKASQHIEEFFKSSLHEHALKSLNKSKVENYKSIEDKLIANFNLAYQDINQSIIKEGEGHVDVEFIPTDKSSNYWESIEEQFLIKLDQILDQGVQKKDIAILVRNGSEAAKITKLLSEKNKIDKDRYLFVSSSSFKLKDNHYIKVIICALRYLLHPDDQINLFDLIYYNTLINKQSDIEELYDVKRLEEIRAHELNVYLPADLIDNIAFLSKLPIYELCDQIIQLFKITQHREAWDFIQTFQDFVLNYNRSNNPDIYAFLEWWDEVGKSKSPLITDDQDAIKIMTIHKSKGLQFDQVIIPFCNWSLHHDPKKPNQIWGFNMQDDYASFPFLPLPFKKDLAKTVYDLDYFEEVQNAALENLNILYVAFTRAVNGLTILAEEPKTTKTVKTIENLSVNELIWKTLQLTNFNENTFDPIQKHLTIGQLNAENKVKEVLSEYELKHYPQSNFRNKISISSMSDNFFLELSEGKQRSINYGNLMHEILSQIESKGDIELCLGQLQNDGKITKVEYQDIFNQLNKYFNHPVFSEWFNEHNEVLLEQMILVPGEKHDKRPDRIIINNNKVTVIDFKFGRTKTNQHIHQIKNYKSIIEEMGYTNVEAYLFYGDTNEVVNIDNQTVQGSLF